MRAAGLALLIAIAVASCAPAPAKLVGTEIVAEAAPDFTLADGLTGRTVTLSAQRDHVVVLTFLYTHCPDVCPLTAETLRQAQQALSEDERARVIFVAVSIDPPRDTPAAVQAFARDHGLARNFVFLIGAPSQLQPVWTAYGVRVEPDPSFPGHSDAIYLIDRKGRARILTHSDIPPADLAADLKVLAAER